MILPETYTAALILIILGMFCWGIWASGFKLAGKWRFELFYFDFAFGVTATAVVLAITMGSLGYDGFTFMDDVTHAGKRQWLFAFLAGVLFNFGNMLMMSSVALAGMSVAFPVAIGMGTIVGVLVNYISKPGGDSTLKFTGCVLILTAIIVAAIAYRLLAVIKHEALARAGKAKSTKRPAPVKAIVLAAIGGILMGCYLPFMANAREGELGMGPYAVTMIFALGLLLSTFILNLFFMNLPVEGEPVEVFDYFKGNIGLHSIGWLSGAVWCIGAVAILAASTTSGSTPDSFLLSPNFSFAMERAAALVAAIVGIVVWKEFREGDGRVKLMLGLMLLLFAGGLMLISLAPAVVHKA